MAHTEEPTWREFEFEKPEHARPVPFSNVGLSGYDEGPYIGLLLGIVLDTSQRPDLEQLIRLHALSGSGDTTSQWAKFPGDDESTERLILTFTNPDNTVAILTFDIQFLGNRIDQAIRQTGMALYPGLRLYPGRPGDTVQQCDSEERESIVIGIDLPQDILEMWRHQQSSGG